MLMQSSLCVTMDLGKKPSRLFLSKAKVNFCIFPEGTLLVSLPIPLAPSLASPAPMTDHTATGTFVVSKTKSGSLILAYYFTHCFVCTV